LADHVLCLSSVDRSYIADQLRVPRQRITRLVNGTDPSDFIETTTSRGGGAVLWIGGWLDVKGRRLLPSVWRGVRERVPSARLTLVGTGTASNEVLEDFDSADRPSIKVIPRLTQPKEMREQYANHDVFLLTSLSEGSPLALLEALAAGLPIVATRVGGVPDIVVDGVHGLLFDPANLASGIDSVCRIIENAGNPPQAAW
jgi:glycosyltransferase involved in cell wall biosynthesis